MATSLSGCVNSLQSSISLLSSSISILDSGVNDFPRLARVLQTTRHFELLPESHLQAAQASLLASLTPEVTSLLARVEIHLDKLARREQALIAKCELQEGRLSSSGTLGGQKRTRVGQARQKGGRPTEGDYDDGREGVEEGREQLRLKQMRQKKERLSYAVERLTLQAQQRERQLRMSMAAQ
ncbi:hypothetical protein MMC19_004640 [Ptychographa xylographoides]|nr:hypothetical protein [Ptychographa xylographoides]